MTPLALCVKGSEVHLSLLGGDSFPVVGLPRWPLGSLWGAPSLLGGELKAESPPASQPPAGEEGDCHCELSVCRGDKHLTWATPGGVYVFWIAALFGVVEAMLPHAVCLAVRQTATLHKNLPSWSQLCPDLPSLPWTMGTGSYSGNTALQDSSPCRKLPIGTRMDENQLPHPSLQEELVNITGLKIT